jgi:hypothetical protein
MTAQNKPEYIITYHKIDFKQITIFKQNTITVKGKIIVDSKHNFRIILTNLDSTKCNIYVINNTKQAELKIITR